jgi:hypothetical protein
MLDIKPDGADGGAVAIKSGEYSVTGRPYRTVCAECLTPSSLMSQWQPECRHEDIMIHQSKQSYPSAPMCCVLDTQLAGVDSGTVVQSLSGQERTREM